MWSRSSKIIKLFYFKDPHSKSNFNIALKTLKCNFLGTLNVCVGLLPLMKMNSRVVNVTSRKGMFCRFSNQEYLKVFKKEYCSIDELVQVTEDYIKYVEADCTNFLKKLKTF
jgi:hypothetical protein